MQVPASSLHAGDVLLVLDLKQKLSKENSICQYRIQHHNLGTQSLDYGSSTAGVDEVGGGGGSGRLCQHSPQAGYLLSLTPRQNKIIVLAHERQRIA